MLTGRRGRKGTRLTTAEDQHHARPRRKRLAVPLLPACACCVVLGCGIPGEQRDAGDDTAADAPTDTDPSDTPIVPGLLRVVFFDVGTGDSILVQAPNGRTLLIDLGIPQVVADGHETDASRRVVERIEALTGRRFVDYFLASHYHSDHIGGFTSGGSSVGGIAFAFGSLGLGVGTFLDRGRTPAGNSDTQSDYLRWAENRLNRQVVTGPGAGWIDLGPEVQVEVIAAAGGGVAPDGSGENGFSLPLRVTFGDLEIALTGDLTGDCDDAVDDVETRVAPAMGAVEVYKVNHHGSQSGSNLTWVRTLHPLASVFSLGESRFGYPHERVVTALSTVGDVYYTRDGDVVLESRDGRSFSIGGHNYTARSEAEERSLPDPDVGVDEKTNALCDNGRDDDRDGYTDCSDYSCTRCPGMTACP